MRIAARLLAILALAAALISAVPGPDRAEDAGPAALKTFTLVAAQIGSSKFWLPSNIIVNQGDKVKLVLKNEIPGADITHGFELEGYNIKEIVNRGATKTVTFTADKPGIFHYFCQLHPAHIGGDLLVVPKSGQ